MCIPCVIELLIIIDGLPAGLPPPPIINNPMVFGIVEIYVADYFSSFFSKNNNNY